MPHRAEVSSQSGAHSKTGNSTSERRFAQTSATHERLEAAKQALVEQTASENCGLNQRAVAAYVELVPAQELVDRSASEVAAMIRDHVSCGQVRAPHTPCVVCTTIDGGDASRSVIDIVVDDMPFLIDSMSAEFARQGFDIEFTAHPQFAVVRDDAGRIVDVRLPQDDAGMRESWMHFEVSTSLPDVDLDALQKRLIAVLDDVRCATGDVPAMRARALELAAQVAGSDGDDAQEGAEFLRWLAGGRFTFMGYREFQLERADGHDVLSPRIDRALGVRPRSGSSTPTVLTDRAREVARDNSLLVISKANTRSTVQRDSYLDYIGVKLFNSDGSVQGEARFLGLYTASATVQSVLDMPVVRTKVRRVMEAIGVDEGRHAGRELLRFLESFPRDELLQIDDAALVDIARSVVQFSGRPATRVFIRSDQYDRFYSVLVVIPADRFSLPTRQHLEELVRAAFAGSSVDTTVRIGDDVNARLHMTVRVPDGQHALDIDVEQLERQVAEISRTFDDDFADMAVDTLGEQSAAKTLRRWSGRLPLAYQQQRDASTALADVLACDRLLAQPGPGVDVAVRTAPTDGRATHRVTLYSVGSALLLSDVLPMLQNLGLRVVNELPFDLRRRDGRLVHVYDFAVQVDGDIIGAETLPERMSEAFLDAWHGRTANFAIDSVVTYLGMTSRQATIMRAYMRYLRQTALNFSIRYLEDILLGHSRLAMCLIELFHGRHDPDFTGDRKARCEQIDAEIQDELQKVESLDADRLLRAMHQVVNATLRTNAFLRDRDGELRSYVSFKLDSTTLAALLPAPRPHVEVWVYSPRVEGVHLRFGPVARGGLRWSDRREDMRTEVLGLVKAQMVKNAVIVPVGAKGGFVVQNPPARSDRDAFLAEGVACYQLFIRGLLDITDNIVDGSVVPPVGLVRHDGDDPYLVVAADKGTATFSDIANAIAADYGFWLGDAFASGGSAGYDHKAMGITAKGAWESVKRHFRELGIDTQRDEFTVVGVGDMSGDVFGNGMLCSEHIRLIAAFDHRDIFIDPRPDAAVSFRERQRLFSVGPSSWQDYDRNVISAGGGVWSRSAKQIDVNDEIRAALSIDDSIESLSPDELISAILRAPADLLWNGGIGTYVKASQETHGHAGDKANDALRVDGAQLRVRVVGEGGNLGFTQLGRIEAAAAGVRLNTDAIDNSAGVDTSDHEVNIKIFLDPLLRSGAMSLSERDELLVAMTDEVATLVLRDNYEQNIVLGNARYQTSSLVSVHRRMVTSLEESGRLDRAIEYLPSDAEFVERELAGGGLYSPELSVLLAYAKLSAYDTLIGSGLADVPGIQEMVVDYFPTLMRERFGDSLHTHPLRRELVTTMVVNQMCNRAGMSFAFRTHEETGSSLLDIASAFVVVRRIFSLDALWNHIEQLDGQMPTDAQCQLYLEIRRLIDRATRWFLVTRGSNLNIPAEQSRLQALVAELAPQVPTMLVGREAQRWRERAADLESRGVPKALAEQVAALLDVFSLLDIADIAERTKTEPAAAARTYFRLSEQYNIDWMLSQITALPREERWSTLARSALRADVYAALSQLTSRVLRSTSGESDESVRVAAWEAGHADAVEQAHQTLDEVAGTDVVDIAVLSVALRAIRSLLARSESR